MGQEIITQPERMSVKDRIVSEYKEALKRTRESYERDGWEVNTQKIETAPLPLREKTDLLNAGRMIDLTSPDCGCKWEVDEKGCFNRQWTCGREGCEGYPYKKDELKKTEKPKRAIYCCEHGVPMHRGRDGRLHCSQCEVFDR